MKKLRPLLTLAAVLISVLASSVFVVDQRQKVVVFRLGEMIRVIDTPGLHLKWPLLDNTRTFDSRILTFDSAEPERFITSEKKNVLVDLFVKWRISDPKQYYITVGGDQQRAQERLSRRINAVLREEFGKRTIREVVSGERAQIMEVMRQKSNQDAQEIGVQVVDVRLKRVELPQEVSESVYRRMEAERKRVANELRSTGSAEGERIRAEADREREVILANAYRDAQKIKGQGDARAAALYAASFGQDAEFARFWRSLEAYRSSFKNKQDVFVINPEAYAFFRTLKDPKK